MVKCEMRRIVRFFWIMPCLFLILAGCQKEIMVESESFSHPGGWVVDAQFVEQVGSPYLMAHGLGVPVENARTTVRIPKSDSYHVWARTKDWAPGPWPSPGRFDILINGNRLDRTMGEYQGWGWNYAGKVHITGGEATLELEDLTGFNGRCDAVYISNRYRTPTNRTEVLNNMRNRLTISREVPDTTLHFDLVVVGGGIAGCAASIAAAEQGRKVALIHDRPVLGGNASGEIRVHTLGAYGYFERILSMLDTQHYPNGSPDALREDGKRMRSMQRCENLSLFMEYRAYRADTSGNSISFVDARHTASGKQIRFIAPYFADCTGDGWIGYWAGAECSYGREPAGLYGESWDEFGELWSPDSTDQKVMGATLLWRTREADTTVGFPEVPWAMKVAGGHAASGGNWQWELITEKWNQADQSEQIRDYLLRAIFGSFYNEKKKDGNEHLVLEWVGYVAGKRESRRLTGDHVFTFADIRAGTEFPDAVVMEERAVDLHYRRDELDGDEPGFLSDAMYYPAEKYYIPYRSLYSKNIGNLFMAGRCFSCSHAGLGGPRVMRTTGQMGAAVGYAAVLCHAFDCSPRDIYEPHLEAYLLLVRSSNEIGP